MIVPDRQDSFEFICKQCGATTQKDIIVVGALAIAVLCKAISRRGRAIDNKNVQTMQTNGGKTK